MNACARLRGRLHGKGEWKAWKQFDCIGRRARKKGTQLIQCGF